MEYFLIIRLVVEYIPLSLHRHPKVNQPFNLKGSG